MQIRLTPLFSVLLPLLGCASISPWPEHQTRGGLVTEAPQLRDDHWAIDMEKMLDSCGLGSGVALSQLLRERGYTTGVHPNSLKVSLHCAWQQRDIELWEVAAKTTQGVCIAHKVHHLEVELEVLGPGKQSPRAQATFRGHQRLKAEPPHRGCRFDKEHQRALMVRGLRAVLHTLPQGPANVGPMVAPGPVSSAPLEAETGPRPRAKKSSVYPVEVGPKPVPEEATGDTRFFSPSNRPIQGKDMAAGGPYPARFSPLWRKFSVALSVGAGGCTDHCGELFVPGPGFGLQLLFRPLDLLAVETAVAWYALDSREPTVSTRHFDPDFNSVELGARFYPLGHRDLQPYLFLGWAQSAVGHDFDSLQPALEGLRYIGRGPALRVGISYPLWKQLRLGAQAGYSFVSWTQLCRREPAFVMGGLGCSDLEEGHRISPSNTWTAGAELGWSFR